MKIKNIAAGDFVQIKKSLCHSEFKAKQVCEVIDIDHTDKHGFDVLIQGKNCLDWVNHKHLKKPEPQLKQLDQSVFDGLDEKWRFAAIDKDGRAHKYEQRPDNSPYGEFLVNINEYSCDYELIGKGYDASNWQNSLIERDAAKELLEVDLSSELTGSELVRAMLERGDRCVMCMVANNEANMFLATRPVVVHGCTDSGFISVAGCYSFAVAVNNQGEPLTASEVGL